MSFVDVVMKKLAAASASTLASLGLTADALISGAAAADSAAADKHAPSAPADAKSKPGGGGSSSALGVRGLTNLELRRFLKRACEAFLFQDVAEALKTLLLRSKGSFGVTLLNAQEPDTVAIAAFGQQMSVALHASAAFALYGSEAAAMKARDGLVLRFLLPKTGS